MASLSEQLRALTNPEPNSFDPENDVFDSTRARLEKTFESSDGDFEASTVSRSVLRKRIEPLLDEQDVKYAGRKVSRARLAAARVTGEDVSTDSNQGGFCRPPDDISLYSLSVHPTLVDYIALFNTFTPKSDQCQISPATSYHPV